jgi:hypothetical protein
MHSQCQPRPNHSSTKANEPVSRGENSFGKSIDTGSQHSGNWCYEISKMGSHPRKWDAGRSSDKKSLFTLHPHFRVAYMPPKAIASVDVIVRTANSQFGRSYTQYTFMVATHHSSLQYAANKDSGEVHPDVDGSFRVVCRNLVGILGSHQRETRWRD